MSIANHQAFAEAQARPLPPVPDVDMRGKTVVVTGCNSGIGFEIVRWYLSHGVEHVVAANRSETRTQEAIDKLLRLTGRSSDAISFAALDLSKLSSVDDFASSFLASGRKLHVLHSNAGTTRLPKTLTEDGFETVAQVNHIATSYLALRLHPALLRTAQQDACTTRSVITGSTGAFGVEFPQQSSPRPVHAFSVTKTYDGEQAMRAHYFTTALFNDMFAIEYGRRVAGQPVLVATTSPGLVETDFNRKDRNGDVVDAAFSRDSLGFYVRTPEEGARTVLLAAVATDTPWAALDGSQARLDDGYRQAGNNFVRLDNMQAAVLPPLCQDSQLVGRVWNDTIQLLGAERMSKLEDIFTKP